MTQLDNPLLIDRIRLAKTQQGKPVINLYHGALKFPALQLFQFHQLLTAGIDPNELEPGKDVITNFLAHWQEGEKINGTGNPYKDVTHLEALTPPATTDTAVFESLTNDLAEIKAMLRYLVQHSQAAPAAAAPAPQPAAPARPEPVEALAADLFTPQFANGGDVPAQHRPAFTTWQKANGRTPTATEFYSSINQAKSRINSRPA
jgi:hypothetical protein